MIYRKRGSAVRWENGTVIRVTESGIAREEGELFTCEPDRGASVLREPSASFPSVHLPVRVERLIMTRGIAEHEYGDKRWREETERLHLSLVHGRERVLIDQGDFDVTHIERIAAALARIGSGCDAPPRLRLAPNITAALLPSLVGLAPPNVRLLQTAGGIDGKGNEIVEAEGAWPNWYRPTYRARPFRAPLNLRLECDVTEIDEDRPTAIALLAPATGLTMRVLVEDRAFAYACTVRITRIDAVATARRWYPYGAGSFGAELML